ncbi:4589_t:CDS:2 [Entrophospora sp. SA101]|nr:4589_t:CDS:2 [Entrophospora sp. SA101]
MSHSNNLRTLYATTSSYDTTSHQSFHNPDDLTPSWDYLKSDKEKIEAKNGLTLGDLGDFGNLWSYLSTEKEKWSPTSNSFPSMKIVDADGNNHSQQLTNDLLKPPSLLYNSYSSEEESSNFDEHKLIPAVKQQRQQSSTKILKKKVVNNINSGSDGNNKKNTSNINLKDLLANTKTKKAMKRQRQKQKRLEQQEQQQKLQQNQPQKQPQKQKIVNNDVVKKVHFNKIVLVDDSSNHEILKEPSLKINVDQNIDKKTKKSRSKIPMPTEISDKPIHVFVDNSNIYIGFQKNKMKMPFTNKKQMLSYPTLFTTIIERGRNVARRELVASLPLIQNLDEAKNSGYNVSELKRVDKGGKGGKKEQCVDELLQLKIFDSLLYHTPGTLVLASGDGNDGEYFQGGFHRCVTKALEMGWKVEIISWKNLLSQNFLDEKFLNYWKHIKTLYHSSLPISFEIFNEKLYMAYIGNEGEIFLSFDENENNWNSIQKFEWNIDGAASLTAFRDKLYLAFVKKQKQGKHYKIFISYSKDCINWIDPFATDLDLYTHFSVALKTFKDKLYMVHVGSSYEINISYTDDGNNWHKPYMTNPQYISHSSFLLENFDNELYLTYFYGEWNNWKICIISSQDGRNWKKTVSYDLGFIPKPAISMCQFMILKKKKANIKVLSVDSISSNLDITKQAIGAVDIIGDIVKPLTPLIDIVTVLMEEIIKVCENVQYSGEFCNAFLDHARLFVVTALAGPEAG